MKYVALIVAILLAAPPASAQQRTRLLVYSTLEPENIADFKKAFEAENPDVEIVWARLHRRRHRQDPGRAGRTAGRCDLGSGRDLDHATQSARPARALCAEEPR